MGFKLLPQDPKFFELFDQQAALIVEISQAFRELVNDYTEVDAKVAHITELEHKGDDLFHEISHRLNSTFVTPIDREDIHQLGSMMDDVLDLVQGAATRMHLFQVVAPRDAVKDLAELMVKCAGILQQGIKRLPRFQDISDLRKPMHALESEGDKVNREAVAALFHNCKEVNDVLVLLKWKEIIEKVENAIDRFEDVFDVLEGVVVKHA